MGLPSLDIPSFTTKLPSNKKNVKFRPFLVKEEKTLLMAIESGDTEEIVDVVMRLLQNCILSKKIDVNKLPTFDVEHLWVQLRAKSVNEIITLRLKHTDDSECDHRTEAGINLEKVKVKGKIKDGTIMMNEEVGIKMKYPTFVSKHTINLDKIDNAYEFIYDCVECIFDAENVYTDFSREDLDEWIGNLKKEQFDKIINFFVDMPKLSHKVEWTCSECGKKDEITIEGLESFFMLG